MKIFYKVNKNTHSSRTKIIERKLENMFVKRKGLAMQRIKKFSVQILKKREVADLLGSAAMRLIGKKNQLYSVFYSLKMNRPQPAKLNHAKLAAIHMQRMIQPIFVQQLKSVFNMMSHEYLQELLKDNRSKMSAKPKFSQKLIALESQIGQTMQDNQSEMIPTDRLNTNIKDKGGFDEVKSLPGDNFGDTERKTFEKNVYLGTGFGLKSDLVTKTHDHALNKTRKIMTSTAKKEKDLSEDENADKPLSREDSCDNLIAPISRDIAKQLLQSQSSAVSIGIPKLEERQMSEIGSPTNPLESPVNRPTARVPPLKGLKGAPAKDSQKTLEIPTPDLITQKSDNRGQINSSQRTKPAALISKTSKQEIGSSPLPADPKPKQVPSQPAKPSANGKIFLKQK